VSAAMPNVIAEGLLGIAALAPTYNSALACM
jgi:hypothetical protein